MPKTEEISVAIITRNEANVLPRLLASLKGIKDIVVMDTGSTDKTVEIARKHGCNVVEVGEKFKIKATQKQVEQWKKKYGREPSFKAGEGYFHFSKARNHAATFTKNDWVFQPDADEVVDWDLDKVKNIIQTEDHLVYQFCYQYAANGVCGLEFPHSKFFRKSKMEWTKWVHEIHTPVKGQKPKAPKFVDFIYHKHYQEPKLERGNYLPGLELSVLENPKDDRNVYYLAREYYYNKKYQDAINMFLEATKINHWPPELGQAYIYEAKCFWALGKQTEAIDLLHLSIKVHDSRREPFWELGNYHKELGNWDKAISYHLAATGVPFKEQGYLNSKELYTWKIHDSLAFLYGKVGNTEESKVHWLKAMKHNPPDDVLKGFDYFFPGFKPKVSIIVPTIRPDGYKRLVDSIKRNTIYSNYELISKDDPQQTAISKFNEGVEESKGEFVVFLADDCVVGKGWLTQALVRFKLDFKDKGLVVLNEGYWKHRMAHHFLCSKNITDDLGGEIWHSGYHHYGADNELYYRLKKLNLVSYCDESKIIHHHPQTQTMGTEASKDDKFYKRARGFQKEDIALLDKRALDLDFGPIQKVYYYPKD